MTQNDKEERRIINSKKRYLKLYTNYKYHKAILNDISYKPFIQGAVGSVVYTILNSFSEIDGLDLARCLTMGFLCGFAQGFHPYLKSIFGQKECLKQMRNIIIKNTSNDISNSYSALFNNKNIVDDYYYYMYYCQADNDLSEQKILK